jgi:hypothetical protein
MARLLILLALLSAACHGPGRVEYTDGKCFVDGRAIVLAEVQSRQADVSARILDRQPWFVVVTLLVVVLAGASHIEKLALLFRARRSHAKSFGERFADALDRYRVHPIRYFTVVAVTLALLAGAAGLYIYLDADKRASERALAALQFCHLALRTADEQSVLDAQRKNLESIQTTAGDIRALVDKLPPEEQAKAQEIVRTMNSALVKQSGLVTSYFHAADQASRALDARSQALEKGLSSVEANVLSLKTMPLALHDLDETVKKVDGRLGGLDGRLGSVDGKLGGLDGKLGALDGRMQALESQLKELKAREARPPDGGAPAAKK